MGVNGRLDLDLLDAIVALQIFDSGRHRLPNQLPLRIGGFFGKVTAERRHDSGRIFRCIVKNASGAHFRWLVTLGSQGPK